MVGATNIWIFSLSMLLQHCDTLYMVSGKALKLVSVRIHIFALSADTKVNSMMISYEIAFQIFPYNSYKCNFYPRLECHMDGFRD